MSADPARVILDRRRSVAAYVRVDVLHARQLGTGSSGEIGTVPIIVSIGGRVLGVSLQFGFGPIFAEPGSDADVGGLFEARLGFEFRELLSVMFGASE